MKISDKQAYYLALAEMEPLLNRLDDLSEVEIMRLDELTDAIEAWENEAYPMPLQPDIKGIVLYVMETRHYNQSEMADKLNVSPSLISGVINGKKEPSISLLKNLHAVFHIDGNMLLQSIHG